MTYYKLIKINNIWICLAAVHIGKLKQCINHTDFEQSIVCIAKWKSNLYQTELNIEILALLLFAPSLIPEVKQCKNLTYTLFLIILYNIVGQICTLLIFLMILITFHLLDLPCSPRKERIAFKRKIWLASLSLSLCFSTAFILRCLFTQMLLLFCGKALPVKLLEGKKKKHKHNFDIQ